MPKPRSLAVDYAIYLLVRAGICLIQAMPPEWARAIAGVAARLLFHLDRRHREVTRENLRQAFPGRWQGAELDNQVLATYRHFCSMVGEIAYLPRKIHARNRWRYVRYADPARRQELLCVMASDRPVLIVSAHLGNWELGNFTMGLAGIHYHAVVRPLDNPFLDRFVRHYRQQTGHKLIDKTGSLDQMEDTLQAGGRVALLADQDAGPRGLFVDFFGRPASTHKAVALLALNHGAPLVVLGNQKISEPMCYQIIVEDIIFPEDYERRPNAVRLITERFSAGLERMIAAAPEQYFWMHRRWKSQPAKPLRMAA
jgi:KDO2-lipid IV(A) lauroyltransferase